MSFTLICVSGFQFAVRLKMGPRLVLVDPEVGLGAHGHCSNSAGN